MVPELQDITTTMLEQLYDKAFQAGYNKAYEEFTLLLKAANERIASLIEKGTIR